MGFLTKSKSLKSVRKRQNTARWIILGNSLIPQSIVIYRNEYTIRYNRIGRIQNTMWDLLYTANMHNAVNTNISYNNTVNTRLPFCFNWHYGVFSLATHSLRFHKGIEHCVLIFCVVATISMERGAKEQDWWCKEG